MASGTEPYPDQATSDALQSILSRLSNVKPNGSGWWSAKCPAHGDEHNSLGIGAPTDGWVRLKCHAGCKRDDILCALNLTQSHLRDGKQNRSIRIMAREGGSNTSAKKSSTGQHIDRFTECTLDQ